MFKLVIQDDEGKTTVVPFISDEITIGRKEGNTIRLTERNVSRHHARLLRSNGAVTIEDLESYNGIKVNGARIQGKINVGEADRVQIGDYLIELKREGQDAVDALGDDAETKPIPVTTVEMEPVDPMAMTPVPESTSAPTTPEPAAAVPPRVVVLSSNFAGQEWNLDKSRLVIGRTDENDIWINHRSISRHHAELLEDDGRWSIVDLQSSNGVRVNGEDYGKVELRRGDIIDLGHVRLRFVDAGEDFVFGRDAQAVDIASGGSGRSLGLILLVALLIGGGAAAFAILSKGGDDGSSAGGTKKPVVTAKRADAAPASPNTKMDAAAETPPKVDELANFLAKAREAVDAESWVEAEKLAKKALELDGDSTEAAGIEQKALLEKAALVFYDEFRQRASAKKPDYVESVMLFNKIADESIYKARARADFDRLKSLYIQRVKDQGERLAKAEKCTALRRLAVNAGKVFADAEAEVRSIACKVTAVATNNTTTNNTTTNNTTNNNTTNNNTKEPKPINVDAVLRKARGAAMRNQWGAARNACESILKAEPGNVDARSICLLAACALKRAKSAKRHYRRLPGSRKTWAVQQCVNQGVNIE